MSHCGNIPSYFRNEILKPPTMKKKKFIGLNAERSRNAS